MLNKQWGLDSSVIPHKEKYFVILIPKKNSNLLKSIITPQKKWNIKFL
jgi:hypothetical protein